MTWGFVGAAAITVIGGAINANSAKDAANTQARAAGNAAQVQWNMYDQNRTDQAPWRAAGGTAIGQLGTATQPGGEFNRNFTLADFNKDPGYQFRLSEGQRGVEAGASARGGILSGAALKGLDRYNQGFASNEYENAYNRFNTNNTTRFNRLASIAGLGQTSAAQTGAAGTAAAGQIGSAYIGAGNAQAAGQIGVGNAVSGGLQTLGNYYLQRQYAQPYSSPTTGSDYGGGYGS